MFRKFKNIGLSFLRTAILERSDKNPDTPEAVGNEIAQAKKDVTGIMFDTDSEAKTDQEISINCKINYLQRLQNGDNDAMSKILSALFEQRKVYRSKNGKKWG
jgi:hypothetical protein